MKLCKLIEGLTVLYTEGDLGINIEEIVYDSRGTIENSLFVAIKGFETDGHKYIDQAIKKGARAVLVQENVYTTQAITIIRVVDTREALAYVSSVFYNHPSKLLHLIGITGTNAKTTTTYLLKSVFEADRKDRLISVIGTIGSVINNKTTQSNNTTPESLDLQRAFDEILKSGIDTCIMEVSSHSLELKRVEYCDFNIGIFTNLSTEHLDFHENIDNYFKAKIKLFYKTKDYNIINGDDVYGKKMIQELSKINTPIIQYGIENHGDVYAKDIQYSPLDVSFTIVTPKEEKTIKMNTPGLFTVYNGLAVAACAYAYGIDLKNIKKGLERIKGIKGRFEVVPTDRDFTVIIDFAHTPDGLKNVLDTIKQYAKGRIITLFGAGGNRDQTKREPMGEVVARYSDLCIVTSDNARSEDPLSIIEDIIKGIKKENGTYVKIIDRREAIQYAIENSQSNDVILLAGKGHETYQIIDNQRTPFNERAIVLQCLAKLPR